MKKKDKQIKVKSQYRSTARMNKTQRKIRMIVLYSLVVIAVIILSIILSLAVLFKIENIQVEGNQSYQNDAIIQHSGIKNYQNIYLCKQKKVNETLCNKFPYIESVELEKQIPNKVIIHVTEAKESASIQSGDDNIIISANNKVLDISKVAKPNIATVNGVQIENAEIGKEAVFQDKDKANTLKQIQNAILNHNLTDITAIDISDLYDAFFVYKNKLNVKLGQANDIDYKIEFASKVIANSIEVANGKGTLDVSICVSDNKTYFTPEYN